MLTTSWIKNRKMHLREAIDKVKRQLVLFVKEEPLMFDVIKVKQEYVSAPPSPYPSNPPSPKNKVMMEGQVYSDEEYFSCQEEDNKMYQDYEPFPSKKTKKNEQYFRFEFEEGKS